MTRYMKVYIEKYIKHKKEKEIQLNKLNKKHIVYNIYSNRTLPPHLPSVSYLPAVPSPGADPKVSDFCRRTATSHCGYLTDYILCI